MTWKWATHLFHNHTKRIMHSTHCVSSVSEGMTLSLCRNKCHILLEGINQSWLPSLFFSNHCLAFYSLHFIFRNWNEMWSQRREELREKCLACKVIQMSIKNFQAISWNWLHFTFYLMGLQHTFGFVIVIYCHFGCCDFF